MNRITTRVIAISPSQAEELAERFHVARRQQIAMVRNGFDLRTLADLDKLRDQTRRRLNLSDDDRLVVWAGRLVPIKNLPLLLEVVGLANRLPQVKFLWPAMDLCGNRSRRPATFGEICSSRDGRKT